MVYPLCDDPWGNEEIDAIQAVIKSGMYTMGSYVKQFETEFAKKFGAKHALMVSSGSAANLLAIAALVYSGRLERGSEVLVPAVSWSTTYFPLEQFGMKLIFVDIDKNTLNISIDAVRNAITPKTKMLFAVNLLGNPNNFDELTQICEDNSLILLEDNCESLGASYEGKMLGTFGVMGTFSTFYSHHMCTMEGGIVVTDDTELYEYMLSLRAHGWTRNLPKGSALYEKKDDPFYESYNFIVPGFNLRPLEMEGAIGIQQLKKIDTMIANRRSNADYYIQKMQEFPEVRLQKEVESSSWFGFAMILTGSIAGQRNKIIEALREAEIEVRPIVAGNFVRNPVIKYLNYSVPAPLVNSDEIHDNGFFIGNHSKNNNAEVDYFVSVLHKILG